VPIVFHVSGTRGISPGSYELDKFAIIEREISPVRLVLEGLVVSPIHKFKRFLDVSLQLGSII
jgi:hypothetical protein